MTDKITRRTLGGLAAVGVSMPLLAACGGGDKAGDTGSSGSPTSPSTGSPGATASGGGGGPLASTSDIPVGGGTIFADQEVVVTQPSKGEFKCFTAICSHQGCPVSTVSDGTINCDCHGSRFDIETGDVEQGPATFALEAVPITVKGDEISLA